MTRQTFKIIAVVALTALMSGCFPFVKKDEIVARKAPESLCRGVPSADKLTLRKVQFVVITDRDGIPWIALSPKDYENLSQNTSDIKKFAEQQKSIIKFYEKCVADTEKKDNGTKQH